jgi:nucleotide-binding universal stress UspA family protein
MIKSILAPLFGEDCDDNCLTAATQVARKFNSHIVGYYANHLPQLLVGDAIGFGAAFAGDTNRWVELEKTARKSFTGFMKQESVRNGKPSKNARTSSASWQNPINQRPSAVGEFGRLFDLTVINRQFEGGRSTASFCEEALFESGRPILIVPESPVSDFGKSILIAWNGSTETARTIALGLPFLKQAKTVCVLTIDGGTVPGPSGEQVAEKLQLHGIKVSALGKPLSGLSVGEAILEEASSLGADLILKGAYTHSRLRQMVFGGATKHIMATANIPVLMAH